MSETTTSEVAEWMERLLEYFDGGFGGPTVTIFTLEGPESGSVDSELQELLEEGAALLEELREDGVGSVEFDLD